MAPTIAAQMEQAIRARWKERWSTTDARFSMTAGCMNSALDASAKLKTKSSGLRESGKFSAAGLAAELEQFASAETAPAYRKAGHILTRVRNEIASRRKGLTIPAADPTDLAAALFRQEARAWMRSMPMPKALQHLFRENADGRLIQAALEAPAEMSGLTAEVQSTLADHVLSERCAGELNQLDELSEAVEVANAALTHGLHQLRVELGFDEGRRFDTWMAATCAATDREYAPPREVPIPAAPLQPIKTKEQLDADIDKAVDDVLRAKFPELFNAA